MAAQQSTPAAPCIHLRLHRLQPADGAEQGRQVRAAAYSRETSQRKTFSLNNKGIRQRGEKPFLMITSDEGLTMFEVGDVVHKAPTGQPSGAVPITRGKVIYIHPDYRYYILRFSYPDGRAFNESFRFSVQELKTATALGLCNVEFAEQTHKPAPGRQLPEENGGVPLDFSDLAAMA